MKKTFYLFNPGRMSRQDNTLKYTPVDEEGHAGTPRYLPVEGVNELFIFGSLDANSALFNFLGKHHIVAHFFDYYDNYTGSFMAREYLQAGQMQVRQTQHYLSAKKRIELARAFVAGAAFNLSKNLRYYQNRGRAVDEALMRMEAHVTQLSDAPDVATLMGLEGNIRQAYYEAFGVIVPDFPFGERSRQPPRNELNALLSFGNMLCYTLCLKQIYHTQLNPTISFLHEPGVRRFSLALDLAEIFKPLLVDRTIFKLINKREIRPQHFRQEVGSCLLKESGRKVFVQAFEERRQETIKHRTLKRSVSYQHLVRLECYKLSKHILGIEAYRPFKAWW